jgi:hypothetical protein
MDGIGNGVMDTGCPNGCAVHDRLPAGTGAGSTTVERGTDDNLHDRGRGDPSRSGRSTRPHAAPGEIRSPSGDPLSRMPASLLIS